MKRSHYELKSEISVYITLGALLAAACIFIAKLMPTILECRVIIN